MEDDGNFEFGWDGGLGADGLVIPNENWSRTQQKQIIIERLRERLLEEMEEDENFAANRIDKLGPNGRELSNDRWDELGEELNVIAAGFFNKSGKQWKEYYNKWRLAVKGVMSDYLIEINRTGNVPPATETPDNMSWRMANIYGWEGTGMDLIPECGIFAHDRGSIKKLQAIFYDECKKRCPKQKARRRARKMNHEEYNRSVSMSSGDQEGPEKRKRAAGMINCMEPENLNDGDLPSSQHNYEMHGVYDAALEELTTEAELIQSLSKATDDLTRTTQRDIDLLRNLCIIRGVQID